MAHISENSERLQKQLFQITDICQLETLEVSAPNVFLFHFPAERTDIDARQSASAYAKIRAFCQRLHSKSTVCILATSPDAAHIIPFLEHCLHFKLWIAVKTNSVIYNNQSAKLPENHVALLVFTRYADALRHTKTRIRYAYCASCGKTTKDYGGKKHTYHQDGTLVSDVWRDIECNPAENIDTVIDRLQDLFGLQEYATLEVLDMRSCVELQHAQIPEEPVVVPTHRVAEVGLMESQLLNEDCMTGLAKLPDNSVDFCFVDPPYNLQKHYSHWDDDMELANYFSWCDRWLSELVRVLKPGRTLAILNIPTNNWHDGISP